jgi:hypothetical protein
MRTLALEAGKADDLEPSLRIGESLLARDILARDFSR